MILDIVRCVVQLHHACNRWPKVLSIDWQCVVRTLPVFSIVCNPPFAAKMPALVAKAALSNSVGFPFSVYFVNLLGILIKSRLVYPRIVGLAAIHA